MPTITPTPRLLKETRLRRGLSLVAAAEQMGIPWRRLNDAELGRRPLPATALAIAEFYGLDVIDLWPPR